MVEKKPKILIEPEQTDEYREGRLARREGKLNETNPYASGRGINNLRVWWFIGWYDEKNKHILGLAD